MEPIRSDNSRGNEGVRKVLLRPPGFARGQLVALVVCAAGGGLLEAGALAIIAQTGVGIAGGNDSQIHISLGSLSGQISIGLALGLAAGMLVVRTTALLYAAHLPARVLSRLQAQMRNDLWKAFISADYSTQAAGADGTLQQVAVNHIKRAYDVVVYAGLGLTALVALSVMLTVAVVVQPFAAAATVALGTLLYAAYRPLAEVVRRASVRNYQSVEAIGRVVNDAGRATLDRLTFGSSAGFTVRYGRAVTDGIGPTYRENLAHSALTATYQGVVLLVLVGALLLAAAVSSANQLAEFGAVVLIVLRCGTYLQQFQVLTQRIVETHPYRQRVEAVIKQYRSAARPLGGSGLDTIESLRVLNLRFTYPGARRPVVDNFSLEVLKGEIVGIAGRTGIGKTTILQLLLRLRRPDGGKYLVNGSSAFEFSEGSWVRQVALVPQDPALFEGTVAENIRMWRDIPDSAIERAARQSHLDEDLARWDDGLQHRVDYQQVISGGQRQRVAIARAVAGSPSLLIMDEPTSAVDRGTAERLFQSIASLRDRMAIIVVAHDPVILESCDRVITLTADGSGVVARAKASTL